MCCVFDLWVVMVNDLFGLAWLFGLGGLNLVICLLWVLNWWWVICCEYGVVVVYWFD